MLKGGIAPEPFISSLFKVKSDHLQKMPETIIWFYILLRLYALGGLSRVIQCYHSFVTLPLNMKHFLLPLGGKGVPLHLLLFSSLSFFTISVLQILVTSPFSPSLQPRAFPPTSSASFISSPPPPRLPLLRHPDPSLLLSLSLSFPSPSISSHAIILIPYYGGWANFEEI